MNRRDVIRTLGGALVVAPLFARAQPAAGRFTIGMLGVGSLASSAGTYDTFYARMRDLGYVEGRNISYEARWAHGQLDALPGLAAELVALRVDVIVASYDPAIVAAKRATSTIPIVMTFASSPAEQGLIASLARPGGNITGFSVLAGTELRGDRLALLKAIVPGLSRVVVLGYVGDRDTFVAEQSTFAQRLGMSLDFVEVRNVSDIDKALSENLDKQVRLRPNDWASGDIVWLMAAAGHPRAVPEFVKQLAEADFKDMQVKMRVRGPDGKAVVKTLGQTTA